MEVYILQSLVIFVSTSIKILFYQVGNIKLSKAIGHQLITYKRDYLYFPCSVVSHIPIGYCTMGSRASLF